MLNCALLCPNPPAGRHRIVDEKVKSARRARLDRLADETAQQVARAAAARARALRDAVRSTEVGRVMTVDEAIREIEGSDGSSRGT